MTSADYRNASKKWAPLALIIALVAGVLAYATTATLVAPAYTSVVTMQEVPPASGGDAQTMTLDAETDSQVINQPATVAKALQKARKKDPSQAQSLNSSAISCSTNGVTALFSCSVTAAHARFAALVANYMAGIFVAHRNRTATAPLSRSLKIYNHRIAHTQATIHGLLRSISQLQGSTSATAGSTLAVLLGEVGAYNNQLSTLLSQRTMYQTDISQASNSIAVTGLARPNGSPSSPHPLLNGAVAFAVMMVIVLGCGALWESRKDRPAPEEDIEAALGLPVLARVPLVRALYDRPASSRSLRIREEPQSAAAEAYRIARFAVSPPGAREPNRTILVTSAKAGEGKSTIAANLAVAFAESGEAVILVDCDIRKPAMSAIFGGHRQGLTRILMGLGELEEEVVATDVPRLWVLPAGEPQSNPIPLLASAEMQRLMALLTSASATVILDCPQIIGMADTSLLARYADAIVLVVNQSKTGRDSVEFLSDALRPMHGKTVGLIVNETSLKLPADARRPMGTRSLFAESEPSTGPTRPHANFADAEHSAPMARPGAPLAPADVVETSAPAGAHHLNGHTANGASADDSPGDRLARLLASRTPKSETDSAQESTNSQADLPRSAISPRRGALVKRLHDG